MVKLIVASIWWFKGICLKPQKWVRQIPWCRLIVTYCMIKVSHLISFSLLWHCFYKGWDAPDNLLRHHFQEVFIWPQCLLQQNDISLTPNPQIDILETPGGHLIAYYEKIWYIKSLYFYILPLNRVSKGFIVSFFLTLCRFNRYAWPFCRYGVLSTKWRLPYSLSFFWYLLAWIFHGLYHLYFLEATLYTRGLEYIFWKHILIPIWSKRFPFHSNNKDIRCAILIIRDY